MRGCGYYSQYEASEYKKESFQARAAADDYRTRWLEIRKVMREYLPEDIPPRIHKLIGRR